MPLYVMLLALSPILWYENGTAGGKAITVAVLHVGSMTMSAASMADANANTAVSVREKLLVCGQQVKGL